MNTSISEIFEVLRENHIVAILLIVAVAYITGKILLFVVARLVRRAVRTARFKTEKDEVQREDTIISILTAALEVIVFIVAALMILGEIGVNIAPLLAGAGVAGVALGFGAQSMVKDYLAGIFIVTENQYRVGDVLRVNQDVAGIVEHISLRATVLRDMDGQVHYVPNGTITIATNMTMEFAQVDLDVTIGYESDLDKVEKVINEVGQQIFDDEAWKGVALEPPYMLRVDSFAESGIIVKIVCKTAPIRQWEVKSEILKRIKKRFDKEAISFAYPQLVVHQTKVNSKKG